MNDKLPQGAITDIKSIATGMMVKVKGDPILHKCLSNDINSEDGVDEWGMLLGHEPRMEYYDEHEHAYKYSASDYVHLDCIEYATPPIPPGTIAIAAKHGEIKLIEVGD